MLIFTCVLILQMARIFGKYVFHCNGIDLFVTLMGNFNWGPISRSDIIPRIDNNINSINW